MGQPAKKLTLKNDSAASLLESFTDFVQGEHRTEWGEEFIDFNNPVGRGSLRMLAFDSGITSLHIAVKFRETVEITVPHDRKASLFFIFLTLGQLDFRSAQHSTPLQSFQNIIVHPEAESATAVTFPENETVQLHLIHLFPEAYLKKKNHNVPYLKKKLRTIFNGNHGTKLYQHFGNFNLHIADQVRQLHHCPYKGIIRTLILEGHTHIILGLQLLEHQKYEEKEELPASMTRHDLEKIQQASLLIEDTLADTLKVSDIAKKVDLSPAKLQLGFKLLYNKTVNEYLKEVRLQKARDLLHDSQLSISEVVYQIGYKSRSYFSQIFSKRYGILPKDFQMQRK